MMDLRIVRAKIPARAHGFAVKSCQPDGDFYTAVISEDLSEEAAYRAALHEIGHVKEDDFTSEYSVSEIENKMKIR